MYGVHGVTKSQTWLSDWKATTKHISYISFQVEAIIYPKSLILVVFNLSGTRTRFVDGNFSQTWGGQGEWFQENSSTLFSLCTFFYHYCIVVYNEVIRQLTTVQNQCQPWPCFHGTRQSQTGVIEDSDTQSVTTENSDSQR